MNPKDFDVRRALGLGRPQDSSARDIQIKTLLEEAGDAAWIKDERLRYVFASKGFEKFAERTSIDILGRTDPEIFPPETADRFEKADRDAIARQEPSSSTEELPGPGEEKRLLAIRRVPLRDEKGEARGLIGMARDITEQRDLEQRNIQSQKMEAVGQLAGGVAHDFNNLLTAIQGYTSLLLTELPPGDSRREHAEEVLKAGERATALTKQLLAFSRRQVLEPRVIDLNEVVTNVSRLLARLIGEAVELTADCAPELWRVLADQGQIEQVILNLAINARDAMPRGGKITIETRNVQLDASHWRKDFPIAAGDYVMLAVSDTGVGIPPEIRVRVFEPFFTTKPRGEGTGLGLSTVYGIVKQSGGFVWVYSEPGNGSVFKVYLPRVQAPLAVLDSPRSAASIGGAETILLVEDEAEVRNLMEKILRLQGYTVISAGTPADAIRLAADHPGPIDLLLTDVVLPGLTGRDVALQVRRLRPGTPVLFVSGYTDDAVANHGVLEPGTNFLQKPFSPSVLGRKIREVLDQR